MTSRHPVPGTVVATRALRRFLRHGASNLVLAGSLAMLQRSREAGTDTTREARDVDLVVSSLAEIPAAIAGEFLCIHLHPAAQPGRVLAQFTHPADAVRIDVFRGHAGAFGRATNFLFAGHNLPVLSAADQAARAAAVCMKIARGGTVAPKHVSDLVFLAPMADPTELEEAWAECRDPRDPAVFSEAATLVRSLATARPDLLAETPFSTDTKSRCPRCAVAHPFAPSSPEQVFAVLGYV